MALYPVYSEIEYTKVAIDIMFKTLSSNYNNLGEERRKRKWLYPKRMITLQYKLISKTNARTLWQFYLNRSGSYDAFAFIYDLSDTYEGEYIGTGDGTTTTFNLPCKSGSGYTIYNNSSPYSPTDYTINTGGGTDGEDNIIFNVAPTSGVYLTADFTGYLKIRCVFAEDKMSYERFYQSLTSTGLNLKGLLNS